MAKNSKKSGPQKPTAQIQNRLSSLIASVPGFPHRAGLPMKDSVTGITTPPKTVAAGGARTQFRIIHTNEMDEYERDASSALAFTAAALPTGDSFQGTDRKAAKLAIASAKIENFNDLSDLIDSLTDEESMVSHKPPITTDASSNRVKEEKRNVHVSAFIYAASREKDNDFHLIVGRDPQQTPEMYMTMEVSGLPPSSAASFKRLKGARESLKNFVQDTLNGTLPGLQYDFYDPPIPVEIDGSLFFDMSHASGQRPGPKSLKSRMPVIWEVHPVTKIVF